MKLTALNFKSWLNRWIFICFNINLMVCILWNFNNILFCSRLLMSFSLRTMAIGDSDNRFLWCIILYSHLKAKPKKKTPIFLCWLSYYWHKIFSKVNIQTINILHDHDSLINQNNYILFLGTHVPWNLQSYPLPYS